MTDALRVTFDVACAPDHAFATWTERIATWWPRDHTISGAPDAITIEPTIGGRIYERTADGREHDWGVVTSWRPPEHLAYRWHLGVGEEHATDVSITFAGRRDGQTRVEIEQVGWERLGAAGVDLRSRNRVGWSALEPRFRAAVERGA